MQRIYMLVPSTLKKYSLLSGLIALTLHAPSNFAAETKSTPPVYQSDEEAFLIRRIAEFWKDGDITIVKEQIQQFLTSYPTSSMRDYLNGILGDMYIQENKFQDALQSYSSVDDYEIYEKIALNKLHCLYELGFYEQLIEEGKTQSSNNSIKAQNREAEYDFLMGEGYFRLVQNTQDSAQKTEYFLLAVPFYNRILDTPYSDVAKFSLAEIYRSTQQNNKGADLYLELAEQFPEKREHLLLNAALLQADLDKENSLSLLQQVIEMRGPRQHEAKFNRLILYFQMAKYEEVISSYRDVQPYLNQEHQLPFYLLVSKSFFSVADYHSAIPMLEKYLSINLNPTSESREALLLLMMCSKHTDNEPLFAQSIGRFEIQFPNDEELPKAYFLRAMICKSLGQLNKTEQYLYIVFKDYPGFADEESLLYEYGIATYQNGNYQMGYDILSNFLAQHPQSDRIKSAWRHYLSCCLKLYKNNTVNDSLTYTKDRFFTDLSKVLKSPIQLSLDEAKEYRLIYAKLAFELDLYNESLEQLGSYVNDYKNDTSLGEVHMLIAMNLHKLQVDEESLCTHLEQALEYSPSEYSIGPIHLQLYNAYLSLAGKQPSSNKESLDKAALHLYEVWSIKDTDILFENQLWLAGYYYDSAKTYLKENWARQPKDDDQIQLAYNRALTIYEKSLLTQNESLKSIDTNTLYLESEVMKLVELLGYNKQHQKRIKLLTSLIEQQNAHPEWSWKYNELAFFELAKSYQEVKETEDAIETFAFIVKKARSNHSWMGYASMLETAKLRFSVLDKSKKMDKHPDLVDILNQLKELQIRKTAITEPIHLEAGLEYVNIRSEISEESLRDSRRLFFLVRMKEDFTSSDCADYLAQLDENKLGKNTYEAYMKFIDAEVVRLQSKQLLKEGRSEEATEYKRRASAMIEELLQSDLPTEQLYLRVVSSKKNLR